MIHESTIELSDVPDLSRARLAERAYRTEQQAKRLVIARCASAGLRVHTVIYSWQVRVKIAGGLRVMRGWMPGEPVPTGAEVLELKTRGCTAELPTGTGRARTPLLQPKGVG